jgi:hypothetical protein
MKKFLVSVFFIVLMKNTLLFSTVTHLNSRYYIGTIAGKYKIGMVLCPIETDKYTYLYGYYYYEKNKIPIMVRGLINGKSFGLSEYLDNGMQNAIFEGYIDEEKGEIHGKWIGNNKELSFTLSEIIYAVQDESPLPEVGIAVSIDKVIGKVYEMKNQESKSSGTLVLTKDEKKFKYKIQLDLYYEVKPDHTGELDDYLEMNMSGRYYYEASPDSKGLSENCILCFVFFNDKIFAYEFGTSSYLGFGMGVTAEGVYVLKR